jgi:hypothetical protein
VLVSRVESALAPLGLVDFAKFLYTLDQLPEKFEMAVTLT